MNTQALATLQDMWKDLTFHTVDTVTARQPQDVLSINIRQRMNANYPDGKPMYNGWDHTPHKTMADVPPEQREDADIWWKDWNATTTDGTTFTMRTHNRLDFQITPDLTWRTDVDTYFGLPEPGTTICGITDGHTLTKWFAVDPPLKLLIAAVQAGRIDHTEDELARLMLSHDAGYPDTYFAIARLLFFDNIQAFIDDLIHPYPTHHSARNRTLSTHPAHGTTYAGGWKVDWKGMWLPDSADMYLHNLAYTLGQPQWWETFQDMCEDQGVYYDHEYPGRYCRACHRSRPQEENPWPIRPPV